MYNKLLSILIITLFTASCSNKNNPGISLNEIENTVDTISAKTDSEGFALSETLTLLKNSCLFIKLVFS